MFIIPGYLINSLKGEINVKKDKPNRKDLNLIVKMKFGSHLYGTAGPDSDLDYKGVYLPTKYQVFLGRVPKCYSYCSKDNQAAKNCSEDIDEEIYSLQYFIKLAGEGQTVALDMLHAPHDMILEKTGLWDALVFHRSKFYTKNLSAFVSYARKQAAKYGIKGSRLNAAKEVMEFLQDRIKLKMWTTQGCALTMAHVWDDLPTGEHIHKLRATEHSQGLRFYQVCGKKLQETCRLDYCLEILTKFYDNYGKRARLAALNQGIDWKALSHALRAAYQVEEILMHNTITFPLKEARFIKAVKYGHMDYLDKVAPMLELKMQNIEVLAAKSTLPEKVDMKFWDDFVIDVIEKKLL
jgi:predicted nucleotidyltransferase